MGTLPVYRPNFLSEENCFSLFKHRAFAEGEEECHPNLDSIGKQIVEKCKGVPLAAKALGGLLRFKREEKEWLFVKESKLWDLRQDNDDSILPALALSYNHLPQHLKQCFAYCSIFPKDYRIEKEILIQLWMANGFFQQKGCMELEDIGNGIFNDLLWRSFFQDVEKDIDGTVVACKMHDLVHDLACSITRDECFSVVTVGDEELIVGKGNTTRHLALDSDRLFSPHFALPTSLSCLRTFFHLGKVNRFVVPPPLTFSNLLRLRVLDLSRRCLETLPESIGNLKLLRYLDLSETLIAVLPHEIFYNLRNLQTLKLHRCPNLKMLPDNMSELTNLRHLDITCSTDNMVRMPVRIRQLKSLHMLSDFIVSEDSGCGVEELQGLYHLGGSLAITCLWKVRDPIDAENAELIRKKNLRFLLLDWSNSSVPVSQTDHAKLIADAFQPHSNIEKLDFHFYGGSEFPSWMNSECFLRLVEISLIGCLNCISLPTLGLLPCLKVLKVIDNIYVECIGNEFYSTEERCNVIRTQGVVLFPSLEDLEFIRMRSLDEWKGWSPSSPSSSWMKEEVNVSVFPVLKSLEIRYCLNLRTFPSLPLSIQHLELWECNEKIFEQPLENLPHLSDLSIRDFPMWSPDQGRVLLQNLTTLQRFEIIGCSMLVSLPSGTQSLTSLSYLRIDGCDGLKSFNNCLQLLTNLRILEISDCQELELLPHDFHNLISLQELQLRGLPKLAAVPVVGSSVLENILFCNFPSLKTFPECLTNQRLLQTLDLYECNNLKSLPEGLQHLTALRHLEITGCHLQLYRRCQKNTGEDWHKIAHIPELFIRSPAMEQITVMMTQLQHHQLPSY